MLKTKEDFERYIKECDEAIKDSEEFYTELYEMIHGFERPNNQLIFEATKRAAYLQVLSNENDKLYAEIIKKMKDEA